MSTMNGNSYGVASTPPTIRWWDGKYLVDLRSGGAVMAGNFRVGNFEMDFLKNK